MFSVYKSIPKQSKNTLMTKDVTLKLHRDQKVGK